MKSRFRHANLGLIAGVALLVVGLIPLHDSDEAVAVLGVVALVVCLGLYFVLEERERRARNGHRSQP